MYLFSIYNIISSGIVTMRENRRLFCIHMVVSFILFINFLGIIFIRVLGIEWLDMVLFEYGITTALLVLNILIWIRLYHQKEIRKHSYLSSDLEKMLDSVSDKYDDNTLSKIAANADFA